MIRCTCRAPLRARVKRVSGPAGRREEGRDGPIAGAGMGADRPLHLEFDSPMFRASLRQPMHPASFRAAGQAPVAQLDRAPDYGSGGWEFESSRARHFLGSGRPAIKRQFEPCSNGARLVQERQTCSPEGSSNSVRRAARPRRARRPCPALPEDPLRRSAPEMIRREREALTPGGCLVGLFCINGYIGYNGLADAIGWPNGLAGTPEAETVPVV